MPLTTAKVIPPHGWLDKWGNTDEISRRVRGGQLSLTEWEALLVDISVIERRIGQWQDRA